MTSSRHAPTVRARPGSRLALGMRSGPLSVLLSLALALAPGASVAIEEGDDWIDSHGISTFGDLKYPADFAHLDYVNPEAPKGGEMSIWAFGSFDSMNPYSTKGRAAAASPIFFESMLTSTADEIGALYCLLCESLSYPEDRSEVIFTLRPGVAFSDGSPLTADDVVFSYNILLEKGLPSFRAQLAQKVETVEALDDQRVHFTFKPDIPTRDLIADVGELPVFSKVDYEANNRDFEESALEPLLGSGPYVLGQMDVGQTIVYRRNPDYWGADLPINIGRNNFDALRIEYYADYNAAFEGFKAGTYRFRDEASSIIWATGYDFPALQRGHVTKQEFANGNKATNQAWAFNLRREKLQDPRVREAIAMMFNFEWSNEKLFYGIYDRVDSFWDNSYLEAEGAPSDAEVAILKPLVDEGLLDAAILTDPPFSLPENSSEELDRQLFRQAGELLDAAGWEVAPPNPLPPRLNRVLLTIVLLGVAGCGGYFSYRSQGTIVRVVAVTVTGAVMVAGYVYFGTPVEQQDDGLRRKDGQTLRFEILNDSQTFDRVINPFVENLRRLGVDALHTRIDNAQMTARERPPQYDYDVAQTFLSTSYIPGTELRQFFGSETADSSTFNKMGLKDPAIDRLIDVVLSAKSKEETIAAVMALDRALRVQRIWIPQWNKNTHTVAFYDVYGHPDPLPPYSLGHVDFWWWDAEKAARLQAEGAL